MSTVENIYRYPIKGFPGERLKQAMLRPNEGIAGDRAIGLGSGAMAVEGHGAWTPCQAFQRMTIRPDLTTFQINEDDRDLRLTSPTGISETIDANSSNLDELSAAFGGQASIHRATGNRGYWDHQDATISIINLSTVESIAKMAGRPIDPLRFRANIYVCAEPWSEFQWLGTRLGIGDAQFDVIRPIDRCKTTSVDVKTGRTDLNMPALLIRHFGHMFCGVYATVHTSGTIVPGAKIETREHLQGHQVKAAANVSTAPALPDWPRPAVVERTVEEAEAIRSLWIRDSLWETGVMEGFKAGQFIRIHNLSESHTWRSYTVSAVKDDLLRITVKRDEGVGSNAIHQVVEGGNLIITGPFGEATLNKNSNALHFMSAGIGITPTAVKLAELAQQDYDKPVHVTHVARKGQELALWDDIVTAANALPNAVTRLYLTRDVVGVAGAQSGRPDLQALAQRAKEDAADVHICGPSGFVDSAVAALSQANVHGERIFLDTFSSPGVETDMRPIPDSEPIKVTLAQSGVTDYWTPADGTLLDFAEVRGAIIPSHCRAGLCKTCNCSVLSGTATRLVGTEGEDEKQTLVCTSIPKETLTLDI
ncbi:MOSC domain-containing protein [Halocynthiibacter styelae]|uniref:MOSC domain-containing protein n=1 Tax=Halocynthiibacter styelae TaxID=2761955 RepID=A0A8J7IE70_9RHOB|nr:MOSC domain-containing protein [Paenihalocynthiibacter styelae]MBI1494384.1 MOSC domain-containing protein [Paenihalocynthiibacter styelae]